MIEISIVGVRKCYEPVDVPQSVEWQASGLMVRLPASAVAYVTTPRPDLKPLSTLCI
jgi:hypothetical protein